MKNPDFSDHDSSPREEGILKDNFRVEKFFIENDNFSSKTIAFLDIPEEEGEIINHFNFGIRGHG
jgi:hypothetical protein